MKMKVNLIRTLCHPAHRIFSPELFANEVSQIKLLLNENGYQQELVNETISNHVKNLNKESYLVFKNV